MTAYRQCVVLLLVCLSALLFLLAEQRFIQLAIRSKAALKTLTPKFWGIQGTFASACNEVRHYASTLMET